MKKTIYLSLCIGALSLNLASLKAQCAREQMVLDYNTNYLGSAVSNTDLGWTGDVNTCTAGTISALAQTRTLQRINYFRHLVGLPDATSMDPVSSASCQEAALMMDANNTLNHNPPTSWTCYTAAGAQGAGSSNLALGAHSASSITLYMYDNNVASLGHRRWVIKPNTTAFGHGSTTTASSLAVFVATGAYPNVPFTAYPSPGFFPAPLANVQIWSFSIPDASFSNATVSMTSPTGSSVPLVTAVLPNGYGENGIGFTPTGIITNSPLDQTYTVTVNNVVLSSGASQNYTYQVTIAPVSFPPQCPSGQSWSNTTCSCATNVAIEEEVTSSLAVSTYPNPFQNQLSLTHNFDAGQKLEVSIWDVNGKIMYKNTYSSAEKTLEIESSTWAAGIYQISIQGENQEVYSVKAIKY